MSCNEIPPIEALASVRRPSPTASDEDRVSNDAIGEVASDHGLTLILLGHGAREAQWSGPVTRVRDALRLRQPEQVVEIAFLEFMSPSLEQCVAQQVEAGAKAFYVLPVFIAQGGHLRREVPEMIAALRQRYPHVDFELGVAVGEAEGVVNAMADHARHVLNSRG